MIQIQTEPDIETPCENKTQMNLRFWLMEKILSWKILKNSDVMIQAIFED